MDKGDMESAKIVAGEVIRFQKESVNLNRMSAKMGAVALKLDSAYRTQQMSAQIKSAVPSMQKALGAMNSSGVATDMAAFEKVFEDLDVHVEGVTGGLEAVTGQSAADQSEVGQLLQQMQAEAGMAVGLDMKNAGVGKIVGQEQEVAE